VNYAGYSTFQKCPFAVIRMMTGDGYQGRMDSIVLYSLISGNLFNRNRYYSLGDIKQLL